MEVVLFASDATNSAEIAMELAFDSIIVQTTSGAEVEAKLDATFRTMRHDTLQFPALVALNLLNILPV